MEFATLSLCSSALACEQNMAAILRAFRAGYCLWGSGWLKLLSRLFYSQEPYIPGYLATSVQSSIESVPSLVAVGDLWGIILVLLQNEWYLFIETI